MKIKTITGSGPYTFDEAVNKAIANGYQLVRRDVLVSTVKPEDSILYAELVLPEPAPEPETIDPFQALHIVKAACLAHKEPCNACPMIDWCRQLDNCNDPTDWELPEVGQ